MSHVETVQVWRCGYYRCAGTESGCTNPECREARRVLDDEAEDWHPVETISHAEFLRDFGRCPTGPRGCRVAEQLTLEAK